MVEKPQFSSSSPISSSSPPSKPKVITAPPPCEKVPPAEVSDVENTTPMKTSVTTTSTAEGAKSDKVPSVPVQKEDDAAPVAAEGGDDSSKEEEEETSAKGAGGKKEGKSRRELPAGAVATLKQWLLSPEHFTHPYPTPQDQVILMQKTGIDKKQLKNWFTNARRRIWKPLLKKQLEQGKLQTTGGGGGGVAVPGVVPGLVAPNSIPGELAPGAVAAAAPEMMQSHYHQAIQQQPGYDVNGNSVYSSMGYNQQPQQQGSAPTTAPASQYNNHNPPYYIPNITSQPFGQQQQQQQQQQQTGSANSNAPPASGGGGVASISTSNSIGTLPIVPSAQSITSGTTPMNKTDSHAVLMELFARDQVLVRNATEESKRKAAEATAAVNRGESYQQQSQSQSQHPMRLAQQQGSQGNRLGSVPALNSWPKFSSVSSLNNLGTLAGVKSITSMSGADLASQGNLNKKGNLAQVKSDESMGRADSYAFLEIFFDDRSGATSMFPGRQAGAKRERDEDNDVGLSLDADDSPSNVMKHNDVSYPPSAAPRPAPLPADGKDKQGSSSSYDNSTLKRAYDDALAARGLMSVSRSSEKLTDLALPAKMQRTLSQEFMRGGSSAGQYGSYGYPSGRGHSSNGSQLSQQSQQSGNGYQQQQGGSQQYPGQYPGQYPSQSRSSPIPPPSSGAQYPPSSTLSNNFSSSQPVPTPLSDPSMTSDSVEVPATTKCSLCHCINIDTQLRPCGHMFHGRCLKPSLQNAMGPPTCPIDHIPMQSAVLAVPTDEPPASSSSTPSQQQYNNNPPPPPSSSSSSSQQPQNHHQQQQQQQQNNQNQSQPQQQQQSWGGGRTVPFRHPSIPADSPPT